MIVSCTVKHLAWPHATYLPSLPCYCWQSFTMKHNFYQVVICRCINSPFPWKYFYCDVTLFSKQSQVTFDTQSHSIPMTHVCCRSCCVYSDTCEVVLILGMAGDLLSIDTHPPWTHPQRHQQYIVDSWNAQPGAHESFFKKGIFFHFSVHLFWDFTSSVK